ncbi:MAG: hypothetical protein JJU12_04265 [Chlamydiales bacterium]|nr:hypothetical protein [Chlamydiales bacterium]
MASRLDLRSSEAIDWEKFDSEEERGRKRKRSSDSIPILPTGPYVVHSPLRKAMRVKQTDKLYIRFHKDSVSNLSFGLSSSHSEEFGQQTLGFSGEANRQRLFAKRKSTRDASKVPEDEGEKPKTEVATLPAQKIPAPFLLQVNKIKVLMLNLKLKLKTMMIINSKIESVVENDSMWTDRKLAELGLLYYYLARDGSVDYEASYIEKRIAEISRHAEDLSLEHEQSCPPEAVNLLPSGRVAYLMRALARLIFTPDGAFNEGGCHAVKILLNSPVSLIINEERRAQIL